MDSSVQIGREEKICVKTFLVLCFNFRYSLQKEKVETKYEISD